MGLKSQSIISVNVVNKLCNLKAKGRRYRIVLKIMSAVSVRSDEIMCEDSVILRCAHGNVPRLYIRAEKRTMTVTGKHRLAGRLHTERQTDRMALYPRCVIPIFVNGGYLHNS